MNFPKVEFKPLNIDENLDDLVWYVKPENSQNSPLNFYKFMMEMFPNLKNKIRENMSNEELYVILEKEVKPILEKLFKDDDLKKYQRIWDKINDNVMEDLEKKLEITWPRNWKIFCYVGLLPVCPRYIKNHSFNVNYGVSEDNLIATTIHELCHFLYFEKWKEIYPNYTEEEFDSPHIAWYLSEAMIDPLINNETFKKYTNDDLSAYPIFYRTFIKGKSLIDILKDYVNNYPITKAIQKSYELFKQYEYFIKND